MDSKTYQKITPVQSIAKRSVAQAQRENGLAWRKEVMGSLGPMKDDFQLAIGAAGLQTADSSGFFHYSDFVPPVGKVADVVIGRGVSRSYAYGEMLRSMLPATETGLRGVLGPKYRDWIACRNSATDYAPSRALFRVWANTVLDRDRARAAVAVFDANYADPLTRACEAFADPHNRLPYVQRNGTICDLPFYSATFDQALAAAWRKSARPIDFDSGAGGLAPMSPTHFFGDTAGKLDDLGQRAGSHRLTVRGGVEAWGKIATHPGNWCDEYELGRSETAGEDVQVWDAESDAGGWSTYFGSNGPLARRIAEIVFVSGMDVTVTSHAIYTSAEAGKVAAHARRGVWPLLSNDGPPVHKQTMRHNPDGSISLRLRCDANQLQIWGGHVRVAPF